MQLDPEILQDFLTESGELLETLEGDLVALEEHPTDPPRINQVFRALHTIKGSASFLTLTNLVSIAHATESALNAARNELVAIDRGMMDMLLQAVDIIKRQMGQVRDGKDLETPDSSLVSRLAALGEAKAGPKVQHETPRATPAQSSDAWPRHAPLELPSQKLDLLEYLLTDLEVTLAKVQSNVSALETPAQRSAACDLLSQACDELSKAVAFFDLAQMSDLCSTLAYAAEHLSTAAEHGFAQSLPRLKAVVLLLQEQTASLHKREVVTWPVELLLQRLHLAVDGASPDAVWELKLTDSAEQSLAVDEVRGTPSVTKPAAAATTAPAPAALGAATAPTPPAATPAATQQPARSAESAADAKAQDKTIEKAIGGPEQTIRVEVGRLETLMNLVGELVLQKNRIAAISRSCLSAEAPQELKDALTQNAGGLDRVTGDIQLAVMRTRMQPLEKLFGKYPRLIRDLCTKTGKKIKLEIEGGDTEVDKSVIEELGDPLVHLLRNSADHGIELPDERAAAGKSDTGTIRLVAAHQGSHVTVKVMDDGRGLNKDRILRKAIERGLVQESSANTLSESDIFRFIFLPGFSTADQVSDLSGRGVGMDVVRTNIEKIKGTIALASEPGKGTVVTITIPLTIAIMQAMMVSSGKEIYALPLANILEIVKPSKEALSTIGEHPVMRLRDRILPLIPATEIFGACGDEAVVSPFAVVLTMNDKCVGLMVSGLIGQQEIVIKPLDTLGVDSGVKGRSVSGATVRDDGGVSLIVDVAELVRMAETRQVKGR